MAFRMTTVDREGKQSSMQFEVQGGATTLELQAITDALDAVVLGSNIKSIRTTDTVIDAGDATPPANENASRYHKWLLRIQDNVNGKIFTHEIGTADVSLLPSASSDFLDLSAGVGLTLKGAIEAAYQSPYGNPGTLLSVQEVSRTG